MIMSPLFFKFFVGFSIFILATGILKHFSLKKKSIEAFNSAPPEQKNKTLDSYRSLVKLYKIFLYSSPIYLLLIPYFIHKYTDQDYTQLLIINIILFLIVLNDFMYRNSLLNNLK
jgi:hypothetical protein